MTLQDKINLFINRAQTKIAELSTTVASDLSEAFVDSANIDLAIELVDAIESLQSETLQWTDYEKELVVDYYSYKAKLSDIAIVNYSEYVNNIAGNSTSNSAWVAPFTALTQKVDANYQEFLDEIARLDTRIDNLDLSTLIPQYLLDEIAANSAARHEHANKTVLDQVTQGHLAAIANNTDHRNNSAIHVTAIQKQNWDAKVTAQQLIDGLAGKANISHTHLMSEIEGLVEALNSLQPEKGDKGDQGDSPRIILGEVTVGETLSITIDDTDPLNVIFNFTIPVGQDGKDFKIEVFGAAAGRLSTLYNNVEEGYTYLGTDNGYLYFRKPFDSLGNAIPATTTTGWTSAKFLGSNGWSPVIGLLEVSDTLVVQVLKGWTGGTDVATKPTIGSDPSYLVYLSPSGFTYSLEEAINVKGSQGVAGPQGKIMFPDASGVFVDRANYDLESAEFVFLDTETGLIYKKLSSTSGDWSPGYQWKGDKGDQGEPGTTEGVFSNWTEDTTGYIKPTEDRKVKADKIALDVTTFNSNLDGTITDVQKLAEAVDELQAGSTATIQPEVSWDGTLKTISIGDSNTEKLAINDTVVSGTIRINYPIDAATISRTKTLILNNSLNSSNVTITWDTVSGTNYFDWIFGEDINLVKAGEIIYIKLENTSNNTVRLLSGKVLDEKVISTQNLPAIGSLTGESQKDVNLKSSTKIGEVDTRLTTIESDAVRVSDIDMSDVNVGEKKILVAEKGSDGLPQFGGAIGLLDVLAPPTLDTLLDESNPLWIGDYITLTGDNRQGQLGENSQFFEKNGDLFLCKTHDNGTTALNGSATWSRNRGQDCLKPESIALHATIVGQLETEAGWNTLAQFKQIAAESKRGSWFRRSTGGYLFMCIDDENGWTRVGTPPTIELEITSTSHPNLTASLAAHDFSANRFYVEGTNVTDETAGQGQEWWDTTNKYVYRRNMNGNWAKLN